jgi:hypothetical protein
LSGKKKREKAFSFSRLIFTNLFFYESWDLQKTGVMGNAREAGVRGEKEKKRDSDVRITKKKKDV